MLNFFQIVTCIIILHTIIISNSKQLFVRYELFKNCIKTAGLTSDSVVDRNTNQSFYNTINYQWNLRLPHVNPLGYFLPTSTQDVQIAVWCASNKKIRVIPKGGGHSFEAYSFGNSKSIIIDFRYMNQIEVHIKEKTVTIGPGAILGPIYVKLWQTGNFLLSMGYCLTVGISGQTLGGGIGFVSNLYGPTIDNIVEMTMVDAHGFSHKVTSVQNPDLFWGLRGVGSGYIGIVTHFKYNIYKASKLNVSFVDLFYNLKFNMLNVLEAWQNWLAWTKQNDPTITSVLTIRADYIQLRTVHIQDNWRQLNGNETFLKTVLQIFPKTENMTLTLPDSYLDFILIAGSAPALPTKPYSVTDVMNLQSNMIPPAYFKRKSFYVDRLFDSNSLKKLAGAIYRMPKINTRVAFDSGCGAIRTPTAKESSFNHNNTLYYILVEFNSSNNVTEAVKNEGKAWIDDFIQKTKFMDSGETYQSYVDSDLKDFLKRYYGDNVNKLVELKRRWDPKNYFQNPESIPVL